MPEVDETQHDVLLGVERSLGKLGVEQIPHLGCAVAEQTHLEVGSLRQQRDYVTRNAGAQSLWIAAPEALEAVSDSKEGS